MGRSAAGDWVAGWANVGRCAEARPARHSKNDTKSPHPFAGEGQGGGPGFPREREWQGSKALPGVNKAMTLGTLYGVGLGPGDPDLLTVKAARLIANARVVAYPAPEGGASFARSIAAHLIPAAAREIVIQVPMTLDRTPAQAAYDRGADAIRQALVQGHDVIALCEGDPLFYGSFMYILARLAADFRCEIVPGVSSLSAAAAALRLPLAARNDALAVVAAPLSDAELAARISAADTIAILKLGRHLPRIRSLIESLGLSQCAHYVARATLPDQTALPLKNAPETAPYFSLILIVKGADPWL